MRKTAWFTPFCIRALRTLLGKFNITPTLDFDSEMSFDVPHEVRSKPPQEPLVAVNSSYNPFKSTSAPKSGSFKTSGQSPAMQNAGFDNKNDFDWSSEIKVDEEEEELQQTFGLNENALLDKIWILNLFLFIDINGQSISFGLSS